jgi:alanine racemase
MAATETMTEQDQAAPAQEAAHPVVNMGPPEVEAGGILTVDLAAVAVNWNTLSRKTMPTECGAVIKADGYGCGIEAVGMMLARVGCKTFFVADLGEARRLRAVVPDHTIYVLNGLLPNTTQAYAEINARPVIGSLLELAEWDAFVASTGWKGGAALHVDTGMNRLGVAVDEAAALAPRIRTEHHGITLLMSHLACAEIPNHPLNDKQIKLFREVRLLFRGIPSSLANSSGIFLSENAHCDLVRPGVALFGVNPTPGKPNPMQPAITLRARIVQVRQVARGETVGYDATFTAKRASRIAVAAVGYADGYFRTASSSDKTAGAEVIVAGQRCPIAGRISMDLMAVDVTNLPPGTGRRGDLATLIGDGITVDDFADIAGTIGYEVLTSLGKRYHRVYRAA